MIILTPDLLYSFTGRDGSPSDAVVVRECFVENVYQIHAGDFAREGAVCVDIGANIGAVSVYAASLGARVVAVEPEPDNRSYLLRNIADNGFTDHVCVDSDAVADVPGEAWIAPGHGHSTLEWVYVPGCTAVNTITLTELFARHGIDECDVLKVDVEGAEFDIIDGANLDTMRRIHYLTVEFDAAPDDVFGPMVTKIAKTHGVQILGSPERGGYIYARRY